MQKFKIVAKTLAGLEEILAKEIEQLGGEGITIGNRMVSYLGDKQLLYKSNLWLRTALRVLRPFEEFTAADPDELYAHVKSIDWSQYVAEGQTIAIDNTIFSQNFRNSRYAIYRAKDAICDWFVEHNLKRPKVAVASADVQLNLHISDVPGSEDFGSECTLSLDSSGDPLYKRGYKEQLTDAPISEVLAAGILLKAGYDGSRDLYDPMCGSGTFLIEAALIAANIPAGLYRKGFGFQRWTVGDLAYDPELWQDLYDDDSQEREFLHHIYGSDISKVALEVTAGNVRSAGLSKYISLEVKDFEDYLQDNATTPWSQRDAELQSEGKSAEGGILVMNPPYGRRLFTDVPTFYKMVGNVLKRQFQGCEAWIISSDDPEAMFGYTDPRTGLRKEGSPFDFVGLKPSLRIDLNNGGIPCQLRKYELFSGKFEEFRREGGELDKQSADQKQDNSHFDRTRHTAKKDGKKREKEGFKKDSGKKERFFDKDGKSFERGHKEGKKDKEGFKKGKDGFKKDKPARTRTNATERSYTVNKDGSISAGSPSAEKPARRSDAPRAERSRSDAPRTERRRDTTTRTDRKTSGPRTERKDSTPRGNKVSSRGNFRRNADGTFEERQGEYQPRGRRIYDPNRPMFGENFDMSKAVLDYTDKNDKNK